MDTDGRTRHEERRDHPIPSPMDRESGGEGVTYEVECDVCDGTGDGCNPLFDRPCSQCGGRGIIEKMEPWELEEEEFRMEELRKKEVPHDR